VPTKVLQYNALVFGEGLPVCIRRQRYGLAVSLSQTKKSLEKQEHYDELSTNLEIGTLPYYRNL